MRGFPELGSWSAIATVSLLAGSLTLSAPSGHRYSEGPPPAHTGGFGEPTCHICHFENPINDPAGSLRLLGLPTRYEYGRTYPIAVVVEHPELRRAGFQLSARFSEGDDSGHQAGLLTAVDRRAQVSEVGEPPVQFVNHTGSGARTTTPGSLLWSLEWRAPSSHEDVIFHVAGNAANDDASELGDHIYTGHLLIPAHSRLDR